VGDKREDPQWRKMEGEGMLEMRRWRESTVGIRVAVGVVAAVVVLYVKVVVEAGTARPLTEEGKQRHLHRHFRRLPQGSSLESRYIEDHGRDRYQLWGQRHGEKLLDEENEK
jgi:hypothetical protein